MDDKYGGIKKPQEVISIFRKIKVEENLLYPIQYPELDELIEKGFYVESFHQLLINQDVMVITFSLRRFNPSTY